MNNAQGIRGASESLQYDNNGQEDQIQKNLEEDKQGDLDPIKKGSSVHFFPKKTDSDSTMPVSLSLSQEMPLSYFPVTSVKNSAISLSSVRPLASRTTLGSFSKTDISLKNQSTNLSLTKKQPLSSHTPNSLAFGEGEDYFLSLFGEKKLTSTHSSHSLETCKHLSVILEEVGTCMSSSIGDVKIAEVNIKGLFVKLINSSSDKEVDIGEHILQQNVGGQAISLFQFLPNIPMQANATVTVWAAAAEAEHQPPTDIVWKEQERFRSSPDCTTILCKPHGEAIAWYTPIHWKQAWEKLETDIEFDRCSVVNSTLGGHMFRWTTSTAMTNKEKSTSLRKDLSKFQIGPGPSFLMREKEIPPSLFPNSSPWCHSPNVPAHPYCPLIDPHDTDTTESNSERQDTSQSARPTPAPGTKTNRKSFKREIGNQHGLYKWKKKSYYIPNPQRRPPLPDKVTSFILWLGLKKFTPGPLSDVEQVSSG